MLNRMSYKRKQKRPIMLAPNEARRNQAWLLILDVQNPKFMTSMIPGAQRLNTDVLISDIAKDQPILVTCLSGSRSSTAARQLLRRGYCRVYVLAGGIYAWQKAGYPVWLNDLPA